MADSTRVWNVDRRDLFAGTSAAAMALIAGGAFARLAQAEAPATQPAPKRLQGAGFYQFKVGNYQVYALNDGQTAFPSPGPFIANAQPKEVAQTLEKHFLPPDGLSMVFMPMLIDTGKQRVLIDTGNGPSSERPGVGLLPSSLSHAGYEPGDIDTILISHAHGDHINGLLDSAGKPAFPKAKVLISEPEYTFWTSASPDLSTSKLSDEWKLGMVDNARKVLGAVKGQIETVPADAHVAPGIRLKPAFGHTPGHVCVEIFNAGDRLWNAADTFHHFVLHLAHTDWYAAFDWNADISMPTRKEVLSAAAKERTLVFAYHFPFPGLGHIRQADEGFEWVPIVWQW